MTRGAVASTLVCAAFIYACAPRVGMDGGESDATPSVKRRPAATTTAPDTGFTAVLDYSVDQTTAHLELIVTNHGKGAEVRFPSGMTHDFVLVDSSDREVWRWSDGRFFTQALQTKQLNTGRSLRYTAEWKDAQPGEYRLIATLHSDTHGRNVESSLTVR